MNPATLNELEKILDKDIVIANQLKSLLEAEKTALVQRKPEDLQNLVNSKLQLLDELENNHHQKVSIAGQNQQQTPHWEDFIRRLTGNNRSTLKKLEEFKSTLGAIEHLNQLNAKIASRMEQSVTELISVLKGNMTKQGLYTQQGNAKQSTPHHTIAKA